MTLVMYFFIIHFNFNMGSDLHISFIIKCLNTCILFDQSPFLAFSHYSMIFCLISRYPTAIFATTALLCSTFSTTLSRYQLSSEAFFLWVYGIVLHKRVGKGETSGVLYSGRAGMLGLLFDFYWRHCPSCSWFTVRSIWR